MKFRMLLWALGLIMKRRAKSNDEFRQQLEGEDCVFQMQTMDKKIVRHYVIASSRVTSRGKAYDEEPEFTIIFKDAQTGVSIMTSRDRNAFMQGIQDQDIFVEGDLSRFMWFQGLGKYLRFSKKK